MRRFLTELIEKKSAIIRAIREYFDKTGAVEVFTPHLLEYPNLDPNIYPLSVEVEKDRKITGYLHTSPEYQMKRILSWIKKDIYQVCHVFRDREHSDRHTVEFMMLEWYRVNKNLEELMDDTKNLFIHVSRAIHRRPEIIFKDKKYSLEEWEKITVDEAFYRYTGVYPDDREGLYKLLRDSQIQIEGLKEDDYQMNFFLVYSLFVEPHLGKDKPTFIYSYPPEFAALSVIENGRGKRFEAYIAGIELVNGYQELTDPQQLRVRLEEEKAEKSKEGREYPIDYGFIEACRNMPPSAGASLGIDRLLMVLLNKQNIRETQGLNWI